MKKPVTIVSHRNSVGELTKLQQVMDGEYKGRFILVFVCDETGVEAPTLLDEGLCEALLGMIEKVKPVEALFKDETQ